MAMAITAVLAGGTFTNAMASTTNNFNITVNCNSGQQAHKHQSSSTTNNVNINVNCSSTGGTPGIPGTNGINGKNGSNATITIITTAGQNLTFNNSNVMPPLIH